MARKAHKMIILTVRFFTNDMEGGNGQLIQRHCWDEGTVEVQANATHDLPAVGSIHFNGMAEIPTKIEEAMLEAGLKVHHSRTNKVLYQTKEDA